MFTKIGRKLLTLLRDPIGGSRNNYELFSNKLWPSALLAMRKGLHAPFLHSLSAQDNEILEGLSQNGYWVTHIDEFCPELSKDLNDSMAEVFQFVDTGHSIVQGSYLTHVDQQALDSRKDLIQFGLSERILNIVENYIQPPVFYRGLVARRDHADGQKIETRLWHKDFEDYKIVKVIIYASDVDDDMGPYEILPKGTQIKNDALRFLNGRVSDENMTHVIHAKHVKSITGRRGTIVFTDTASCFHRGKLPTKGDRNALFYAYNSTRPRAKWGAGPLYDLLKVFGPNDLTPQQRRAALCPYESSLK